MRPRFYRRDGTPYSGPDALIEWARDFENFAARILRQDELPNGYQVSTVWLGCDHQWGDGPPLIFETMVFPGDYCERYSTEDDAIIGHLLAVDIFAIRPVLTTTDIEE